VLNLTAKGAPARYDFNRGHAEGNDGPLLVSCVSVGLYTSNLAKRKLGFTFILDAVHAFASSR
jgi:hypothetical protein